MPKESTVACWADVHTAVVKTHRCFNPEGGQVRTLRVDGVERSEWVAMSGCVGFNWIQQHWRKSLWAHSPPATLLLFFGSARPSEGRGDGYLAQTHGVFIYLLQANCRLGVDVPSAEVLLDFKKPARGSTNPQMSSLTSP